MQQDLSDILINTEKTKDFVIEYAGKEWKFKLKELPYTTITRIGSQCVSVINGRTLIDKSEYDVRFLEEALVEAPWDLKLTRKIMGNMKKDFGNLLAQHIAQPFEDVDDGLKKESEK